MSTTVYCSINSATYASRLYLFAETSSGYFGHDIGSPTSGTKCESTSNSLRIVAVPISTSAYYCTGWYNTGSDVTVTNYGLLTATGTISSTSQNQAQSTSISTSGPRVVIVDEHGTHSGTPSTPGRKLISGCVVGVKHTSTEDGYDFKGWTVETSRSTVLSAGGTTSGGVTTFTASYGEQYAIVVQLGTSSVETVTITALYEQSAGPTYTLTLYNDASVYATRTGTADSGIVLPSGPTPPSGYSFSGWSINGSTYGAGATYYPSGTTYSIRGDAVYQQLTYRTLSYVSSYGNPPSSQQEYQGTTVYLSDATSSMTSAASAAGYSFSGWLISGTLRQPGYSFQLNSDMTAVAQFERLSVTVEYYTGYPQRPGTLYYTDTGLSYGDSYTLMAGPSRSGYDFVGWLVTDEGGESSRTYNAGATIILKTDSTPITVVALWSNAPTFSITYLKNDSGVTGADIPVEYVTQGRQVVVQDPVLWSLPGYTFGVWQGSDGAYYRPGDYITPSGNLTLSAIWDPDTSGRMRRNSDTYVGPTVGGVTETRTTISGYDIYLSTSVKTESFEISYQRVDAPYVGRFTKDNKKYAKKNTTYRRKRDPERGGYVVDWDSIVSEPEYRDPTANSGTVVDFWSVISQDSPSESTVSPSNTTLIDLSFGGVYSYERRVASPSGSNFVVSEESYSLSSWTDPIYEAPEIPNYVFKGWFSINQSDDSGNTGTFSIQKGLFTHLVSADRRVSLSTIEAKCNHWRMAYSSGPFGTSSSYANPVRLIYEGIEITVLLDATGGMCNPCFKFARYGDTYGSLPVPTKSGTTFVGWFTESSGGTQITDQTVITTATDHTIYAHWTSAQTLYFDAMGGVCSESSRQVNSGAAYGQLPMPTWTYHTFVGWFTEPYGGAQVSAATTMGDDDTTIYAHWTDDTTTVTFDGNGGEPSTQTITYPSGSIYGSLPSATRSGYILTGWFTAATGGTRVEPSDMVSAQPLYAQWQTSGGPAEGVIWNDFVI